MPTPSATRVAYHHLRKTGRVAWDASVLSCLVANRFLEAQGGDLQSSPLYGWSGAALPRGEDRDHTAALPGDASQVATRHMIASDANEVAKLHLSNGGATFRVIDAGNGPEFEVSIGSFGEMDAKIHFQTDLENLRRIADMLHIAAGHDGFSKHWDPDGGLSASDAELNTYETKNLLPSMGASLAWWKARKDAEGFNELDISELTQSYKDYLPGYEAHFADLEKGSTHEDDTNEEAPMPPAAPTVPTQVAALKVASTNTECAFYKATDGKWYMDLEAYDENEDGEQIEGEMTSYGPFPSFKAAEKYLRRNFANPGGHSEDDSGRQRPPRNPVRPRGRRWAFNKYNPDELLTQLVQILEKAELEGAVSAVKKLTPAIQRAWRGRERMAALATYPVEGPYGIDYPDGSAIRHSGMTLPIEPLFPDRSKVAKAWFEAVRENDDARYAANIKEVRAILERIGGLITAHEAKQAADTQDWGYAGDLDHAKHLLGEVNRFLTDDR